ncbi:hypothetical protein [Spirochaeta dissipatitropha]
MLHKAFVYSVFILTCILASIGLPEHILAQSAARPQSITEIELPKLRSAGSNTERDTADRIAELLISSGTSYQILGYDSVEGFDQDIPFSDSRVIYIPPAVSAHADIVLAVPLDQPADTYYPGLDTGILTALRWATELPDRRFAIALLGGEFNPDLQWGSAILSASGLVDSSSILYLAAFDANSPPEIITGSRGRMSPRLLVTTLVDSLDHEQILSKFPGLKTTSYRLNRNTSANLLGQFMYSGIPSIGLELGTPDTARSGQASIPAAVGERGYAIQPVPWAEKQDFSIEFESVVLAFLNSVTELQDWEELYGVIPLPGGATVIIPEGVYIRSILAVMLLGFLLVGSRRKVLRRYTRTVLRHFWIFLFVLLLLFTALTLSSLIINMILRVRSFSGLWEHYTSLFMITKALSAMLFGLLFMRLFHKIITIPHGRFFSAAAVVSSFLCLLIFSSITLAYTYSFLLIFFTSIAFSIGRKAGTKGIFLLLTPIGLILPIAGAVQAQDLQLIDLALFSPISGNLLLAILFLPFFLMGIRMHVLLHRHREHTNLILRFSALLLAFTNAALIIILFQVWPFSADNPQMVSVNISVERDFLTEQDEYSAIIEILSDAPVQNTDLYVFGRQLEDETGLVIRPIAASSLPRIYAEIQSTRILQRQEFILMIDGDISGDTSIERMNQSIISQNPLFIYYSDIPVQLSMGRTRADYETRYNIELPDEQIQVLSGNRNAKLEIEIYMNPGSRELFSFDPAVHLHGNLRYYGSIPLEDLR